MWGTVIVMTPFEGAVRFTDHTVATSSSELHAGDDLGDRVHHYRQLRAEAATPGTMPTREAFLA